MKAIGADLGGHKIAAALVDYGGGQARIEKRRVAPTPDSRTISDVTDAIVQMITELSRGEEIAAVGIGLPGFIAGNRRRVEKLTNFSNFDYVEFAAIVESALEKNGIKTAVFIENDANCFAIGEGIGGAARGLSDYVVLTLGTGIGAGIVAGGKLLLGAHGHAGEAGHITGLCNLPCKCGGFSHVETLAAADGVEGVSREKGLPADFKTLWERRGEAAVWEVLDRALDELARCIASVSVITDPEIFILSGGMSRAENLISELRPRVVKYLPASFKPNLKIEISELGEDAVFYGAASLFRG